MIKIISKQTKKLTSINIKKICLLKDAQWKHGIKSQLKWFKSNIKSNDSHNLFFIKNTLIGYTLLRKRTLRITNKNLKYFLFDTLILKKKLRKKKLSTLMMYFNNNVIKKNQIMSLLICKKKQLYFYKKYGWKRISKKKFVILDHHFNDYVMIFNCREKYINSKNKLEIFINK